MTTLPEFNKANFKSGTPIDNPYYPLKPGNISVYEGEKKNNETGQIERETNKFAVTYQTENIAGVTATVVRDTAWTNGFLQEDTRDWFAQDTKGNVWYLGESVTNFEYDDAGNFIGTNDDGSWKTGVNGAKPGYIMKANPQVGDNYYQEFAVNDGALDQAKIVNRDRSISPKLGYFNNVLQTLEFSELIPGISDYKYYAPGIGLVLVDEKLDANLKPESTVELASIASVAPEYFTNGRGTDGDDALDGNNKDNVLRGERGNDFLKGFGGKDRLLGQEGNDFLIGGSGADTLIGGNGQDILVGSNGADILNGGKGRDQFVFRTLEHKGDVIQDFTRQDAIVLTEIFAADKYGSANRFEDYLQIQQVGSRTVIRIDVDGDLGSKPFEVLATLQNTNASILSENNFVV